MFCHVYTWHLGDESRPPLWKCWWTMISDSDEQYAPTISLLWSGSIRNHIIPCVWNSNLARSCEHVQMLNGFWRLCFRLRAALLCRFSLSFTTCFGLHGHLQVCKIFYFHMLEGFCLAAFFLPFFFHMVTLCMFSICVLFLYCFPSLFLLFPCVCLSACSFFVVCMFCNYPTHLKMAM
jgi:hypothetical protein